jgi:nucleoside 2-deoxyribosyltransferase
MASIYLATSWRNEHYDRVLKLLRDNGHEVFDYREKGFLFSQLVPEGTHVESLPAREQQALLNHPTAEKAFEIDFKALRECEVCVMLYPCGNDAHVELGFAKAYGNHTIIYVNEGYRAGLMDKIADQWVFSDQQLLEALR